MERSALKSYLLILKGYHRDKCDNYDHTELKTQKQQKVINGMFSVLLSISVLILHTWFALLNATKHWADIFQESQQL